ncbi:MAG TPA: tRNA 2-thiouridine(34) synthase MnmA [Propionicimonas sp.]|nr:tRNA 2-thiouridine(34) synthase MnmA [Propionicimonas sp.]HQA77588.1 tRNA 2-thiouridine(34) synthase MnmA [Propionicimonas sp.]HQD96988.1 tRNA 2-thiouridine(34) synthase MnmA [Propionicimonas sp.]
MRVLAAMSGGVDSAVAAARLVDAGHEVVGVHLALAKNSEAYRSGARGCCSLEDSHDARRAADALGIPFYVWDFAERFAADVVADFVDEYAAGRTPNPCLRCNEKIKFAAVLERGRALGFDAVATGHYARIERSGDTVSLYRSPEPAKDQSYVLGVLDADQLRHSLFPLGADTAKAEVRAEAAARGLLVARKPDSHDICFIPTGDTAGFLRSRLGSQVGDIVDETGDVVGAHSGYQQFTVGQRHGLHLSVPAADGRPRYVLRIDPVANTVQVGPRERLAVQTIEAIRPTWTEGFVAGAWRGLVQVRAHGEAMPATIHVVTIPEELSEERGKRHEGPPPACVRIVLDQPALGIAPGQAAVYYDGDRVVGSATISATAA